MSLTGDLVSSCPLSFHSPTTSSSDISVSKLASSFSTTSRLDRGFRISASRSERNPALVSTGLFQIFWPQAKIFLKTQTSECELGSVSAILHLKGVVRHVVGLAVVDDERHVISVFVDFHLVRRNQLVFSFQPLPVRRVLKKLAFEHGLGLRFHVLVPQGLHQPVLNDLCRR